MSKQEKIDEKIRHGQIGIIPTDTIYGVAASVWSKKVVERAYKILKRNPKKPFIILVSSLDDLKSFGIKFDRQTENILKKIWPGKVSVILPCLPAKACPKLRHRCRRASASAGISKKLQYLHRGTKSLAFRLPKKKSLVNLLEKTGPLISSSANPEGKRPAETIPQAKKYFGNRIDFYSNSGKIKSLPSTLVEIKNGRIRVLRKGTGKIQKHVT